jgi:hypothetical protein
VYQFACTEQKAPDNPEAVRSQHNCGTMPPLWHIDFCKMCVPQVWPRCPLVPCGVSEQWLYWTSVFILCIVRLFSLASCLSCCATPVTVFLCAALRHVFGPRCGPQCVVRAHRLINFEGTQGNCEGTQANWTAGKWTTHASCCGIVYSVQHTVLIVGRTTSLNIQSTFACDNPSNMFRQSTAPPSSVSPT